MTAKNKIRLARTQYILQIMTLYLGLVTVSMFFLSNLGISQLEKLSRPSILTLTNSALVADTPPSETPPEVRSDGGTPTEALIQKIKATFSEEPDIALAVAKGESGLHTDAIGYNCRYNGFSQSCKPEDRENAWSVDCGLYQINRLGKTCPTELFNPDTNLKEARAKYEHRGWTPWVAWNNGQYKNHLE